MYAGTRQPFAHSDERVVPLVFDVTNAAQIQDAVGSVDSLDILVNNAGIDLHDDLSDRAGIDRHLAVNLFGTHGVIQAFLPLLAHSQGAIVNVLSLAALASVPFSPAYAISKAAEFSLTQSLRALLSGTRREGVCSVSGSRGHRYDSKPRYPESFCGVCCAGYPRRDGKRRRGHLPRSDVERHRRGWRSGTTKALERQFAAYTPENMAKTT